MNVLVSGGGMEVPIDAVRAITNSSTGRFSAEITEALLRRGARVWHLHAKNAVTPFFHRAEFDLKTDDPIAEQTRLDAVRKEYLLAKERLCCVPLTHGFVDYEKTLHITLKQVRIDVVILAMAVPDYQPELSEGKVSSDLPEWNLKLHPTPKIIAKVRDWAPEVFLVGFKMLVGVSQAELIEVARKACEKNRADLTVANELLEKQAGRHTVHLVNNHGVIHTLRQIDSTIPLAEPLVDAILQQYALGGRSVNHDGE